MNKRVTIVDVAARAGVAISSASAALNGRPGVSESTRQRVRDAATELSFVPSLRGKSLSAKRAFAVGLVVQRETHVLESDPFFGSFIGGIEEELSVRGYALVLQMGKDQEQTLSRYRQLAADRRVDGVFLNELQVNDPRIPLLKKLGLPAVAINADLAEFPLPAVRQDGLEALGELVDHLAQLGHRTISFVTGPSEFLHSNQRFTAWKEAVERAKLNCGPVFEGDFTYQGGRRAADALLALDDRPTAVMCANDLSAVGLIGRLQDAGIAVPSEVSVTGFDGIELGNYIRPTLSTVAASPRRLGTAAAKLLLDVIENPKSVSDVEIPRATVALRGSATLRRAR